MRTPAHRLTRFLLLVTLVVTASCVDRVTAVEGWATVKRFCLLKGDTIGVLRFSDPRTGVTTNCVWLTSDVTVCDSVPHERYSGRCVVGAPPSKTGP